MFVREKLSPHPARHILRKADHSLDMDTARDGTSPECTLASRRPRHPAVMAVAGNNQAESPAPPPPRGTAELDFSHCGEIVESLLSRSAGFSASSASTLMGLCLPQPPGKCPATAALNNLMHLEEMMLDSMTAVVSQGSLSGYRSPPLWCLFKYSCCWICYTGY